MKSFTKPGCPGSRGGGTGGVGECDRGADVGMLSA